MKSINRDAKEKIANNAVEIYRFISSCINDDNVTESTRAIVSLKEIIEITCGSDWLAIVMKKMER